MSTLPKPSSPIASNNVVEQESDPVSGMQRSVEPPPGIVNLMVGSGMSAISQPAAPKTIETSTEALKTLTQHLLKSVHTDSSTLLVSRFGTSSLAAGLVPFASPQNSQMLQQLTAQMVG